MKEYDITVNTTNNFSVLVRAESEEDAIRQVIEGGAPVESAMDGDSYFEEHDIHINSVEDADEDESEEVSA